MTKINTCCGAHIRRSITSDKGPLPPNPQVNKGVAVIYVGSGNFKIKGNDPGTIYYASDHYRHFKVFEEDAALVLKNRDIILKP